KAPDTTENSVENHSTTERREGFPHISPASTAQAFTMTQSCLTTTNQIFSNILAGASILLFQYQRLSTDHEKQRAN
ncbi:MAG: hypothetical protein J0653_03015, partial [Deltaproteobacteria bacterium]|nr:hypothetical protein [Deltaproteobacteria bacterium]